MNFKKRGALIILPVAVAVGAALIGTGHSHAQYGGTAVPATAITSGANNNPGAGGTSGVSNPGAGGTTGVSGVTGGQAPTQALPTTGGGIPTPVGIDGIALLGGVGLALTGVAMRRRSSSRK